jgi:hypothetical protein
VCSKIGYDFVVQIQALQCADRSYVSPEYRIDT